jgi:hypothetical protein
VNTTYVVVAGNFARGHTLYGPFGTVEAAHEWANDPLRAEETRAEFRVVPLFGGLLVTGEDPAGPPCSCGCGKPRSVVVREMARQMWLNEDQADSLLAQWWRS